MRHVVSSVHGLCSSVSNNNVGIDSRQQQHVAFHADAIRPPRANEKSFPLYRVGRKPTRETVYGIGAKKSSLQVPLFANMDSLRIGNQECPRREQCAQHLINTM